MKFTVMVNRPLILIVISLLQITPDMPESLVYSTPAPVPISLEGDQFDFSTADIERRDFTIEFGIIVIFPLALMLVILLILSYAMFGGREGV